MKLREYEFTYVLRADLPESERVKVQEKYESFITKHNGQILRKEDWGVQKLSYPIKKSFKGHYIFYDFIADPNILSEYERILRIDDKVLRYLLIKINDEVDIEHRKNELAKKDLEEKVNIFAEPTTTSFTAYHEHEEDEEEEGEESTDDDLDTEQDDETQKEV